MTTKPELRSNQTNNQNSNSRFVSRNTTLQQAFQQIHQLQAQNDQLRRQFEEHLQNDWQQLQSSTLQLDFDLHHLSALGKVKQQLALSLNALDSSRTITKATPRKDEAPAEIVDPGDQNWVDSIYFQIMCMLKSFPGAAEEQLRSKIQLYHSKIVGLKEDYVELQTSAGSYRSQAVRLEGQLLQAESRNKNIYNQLLEATLNIQKVEHMQGKFQAMEREKQRLLQQLTTAQQQPIHFISNTRSNHQFPSHPKTVSPSQETQQREIRKCHQQIATLKEQNRRLLTKGANKISSFLETEKGQVDLANMLLRKRLEESDDVVRELRKKVDNAEESAAFHLRNEQEIEKYQEEIYLLRIKVFALQSLEVAQRHKINHEQHLQLFLEQIRPFCHTEMGTDKWKVEVLHMMAEAYSNIKQLDSRLEQQFQQLQKTKEKYKRLKQKYVHLSSSREATENQMVNQFRHKANEYAALVSKMKQEMDKANAHKQQPGASNIPYPPLQQIQVMGTQLAFFKKDIAFKQTLLQQQTHEHQNELNRLLDEVRSLKNQNSNLNKINRELQAKILEQNLDKSLSHLRQSHLLKRSEQKSFLLTPQASQVMSLEKQLAILNSRLQQQGDLLAKEKATNQRLLQVNHTQDTQLTQANHQLSLLKQKIKDSLVLSESERNSRKDFFGTDEETRSLLRENAVLKNDLMRERGVFAEMIRGVEQSSEMKTGYQKRVQQVEDAMREMNNRNEDLAAEIKKMGEERLTLQAELLNLQDQLSLQHNPSPSLKDIEIRKQFEREIKNLQTENEQIREQLKEKERLADVLRKECDVYCQENVKLLLTIKENDIQGKDISLLHDHYQEERKLKLQALENQLAALKHDNQLLQDRINNLSPQNGNSHSSTSKIEQSLLTDISQLKAALAKAQNQKTEYRQELEQLLRQRQTDKKKFSEEWEKMKIELQVLSKQLQNCRQKSQVVTRREESGQLVGKEQSDKSFLLDEVRDEKIVKSEIIDITGQLIIKNNVIKKLQEELALANRKTNTYSVAVGCGEDQEEERQNFIRELYRLRDQNQQLREKNYKQREYLRTMEHQYNTLRAKMISGHFLSNQPVTSDPLLQIHEIPFSSDYPTAVIGSSSVQGERGRELSPALEEVFEEEQKGKQRLSGSGTKLSSEEQFRALHSMAPLVESVKAE